MPVKNTSENKPMTTKEAFDKYGSKKEHPCPTCNNELVEGQTFSVRCKQCRIRLWWSGNWRTLNYVCPGCGTTSSTKDH
jgi:RNase P subunit RPR2